jgi:hypothetical protein
MSEEVTVLKIFDNGTDAVIVQQMLSGHRTEGLQRCWRDGVFLLIADTA